MYYEQVMDPDVKKTIFQSLCAMQVGSAHLCDFIEGCIFFQTDINSSAFLVSRKSNFCSIQNSTGPKLPFLHLKPQPSIYNNVILFTLLL